jgi:hypothetical protein
MEEALVGLLSYAAQLPLEAWTPEAAVHMLQVLQALQGQQGVQGAQGQQEKAGQRGGEEEGERVVGGVSRSGRGRGGGGAVTAALVEVVGEVRVRLGEAMLQRVAGAESWDCKHVASLARFLLLHKSRTKQRERLARAVAEQAAALLQHSKAADSRRGDATSSSMRNGPFSPQQLAMIATALTSGYDTGSAHFFYLNKKKSFSKRQML